MVRRTSISGGPGSPAQTESQTGAADERLDALYRNHFPELCANIRKSFGSGPPEPEDAVQTAFAKFAKLENPAAVRAPRAFLYIAARNVILDHKRSAKVAHAAEKAAGHPRYEPPRRQKLSRNPGGNRMVGRRYQPEYERRDFRPGDRAEARSADQEIPRGEFRRIVGRDVTDGKMSTED